jgi:uncharacterized membrane protein YhaH (DUF805 family)
MDYYTGVFKKYADFSGRARRKEYWMFALINVIVSIIIGIIDGVLGTRMEFGSGMSGGIGILGLIYTIVILVPSLALMVRRLHDTNRSGLWLFIVLIPFLGALVMLVFSLMDSTPGSNKYGPNPKGVQAESAAQPATAATPVTAAPAATTTPETANTTDNTNTTPTA